MAVTAVIVTRGDVDLARPLAALDQAGIPETVVYDNSGYVSVSDAGGSHFARIDASDVGAYGRYDAIRYASGDVILTQDDDTVVAPDALLALLAAYEPGRLVSNMNPHHNGTAMPLLALPGWGAVFDRDLPARAFARWRGAHPDDWFSEPFLRVGCDIVFPVLTPSRMIDLGHEDLPWAWDPHRTHVQPGYAEQKTRYYVEAARLRAA